MAGALPRVRAVEYAARVCEDAGPVEKAGETFPLPIISIDPGEGARLSTGMPEVDRVLGGGLMRGSATLIGGEPGIGKSTLLLQLCAKAQTKGRLLYISGEESPAQIRMRADRLGALREGLEVFCSSDLGMVRATLDALKPVVAVIDSIQTLRADEAGSVPGTANQIKYCAQELSAWAKAHDAALLLVAHVTKEGVIAGPKAAEHLVDAVLGFEQGEGDMRVLRASKNRFGSAEEVGLFRMGEAGLEEVTDPSGIFLVRRDSGKMPVGTAIAPVHEGSRVLLVEIQALTVPAKAGLTRVYSERIETGRVSRIAAILEKRMGLRFSDQESTSTSRAACGSSSPVSIWRWPAPSFGPFGYRLARGYGPGGRTFPFRRASARPSNEAASQSLRQLGFFPADRPAGDDRRGQPGPGASHGLARSLRMGCTKRIFRPH